MADPQEWTPADYARRILWKKSELERRYGSRGPAVLDLDAIVMTSWIDALREMPEVQR